MARSWDESADFIVVGSGAGSVIAALVCRDRGKSAIILEKQGKFGGSTSLSGGVLWIPGSPQMARDGIADSFERGREYLRSVMAVAGDGRGPGKAQEREDAFLRACPETVLFLERHGLPLFRAKGWSDYYDDLPGGEPRGRSLFTRLFDLKKLGGWAEKLNRYTFGGRPSYPISTQEFKNLMLLRRTWAGKMVAVRIGLRMIREWLTGARLVGAGAALQGRMLRIALDADIPIHLDSMVRELVVEDGRVTGVIAHRDGRDVAIEGRLGVLIDSGGFSRNQEMRDRYHPSPSSSAWTIVNQGDTGDMHQAAQRAGAALAAMHEAWWAPGSFFADGSFGGIHSPMDIGKPHAIVVNQQGRRFGNEAAAYVEFGRRMYEAGAVPAWAIMDSRHRAKYFWGVASPGSVPQAWVDEGYAMVADTLEGLAEKCGIDAGQLAQTVERFNKGADAGVDEEFGRGSRQYNHYYADPTNRPSPTLGALRKPPFWAVRLFPSDVGTAGGILTDGCARAVREDGTPIPGLYAAGNAIASIFGGTYPGAGASISQGFVFGFIAANHACQSAAGEG